MTYDTLNPIPDWKEIEVDLLEIIEAAEAMIEDTRARHPEDDQCVCLRNLEDLIAEQKRKVRRRWS